MKPSKKIKPGSLFCLKNKYVSFGAPIFDSNGFRINNILVQKELMFVVCVEKWSTLFCKVVIPELQCSGYIIGSLINEIE